MLKSNVRKLIYSEKYHENCHDYLKNFYIEKYAEKKYKKILYQIKDQIPKIPICYETPKDMYKDIIVCDQHATILTHHLDIFPIVATYSLNACVGLVIYIPSKKIGCIAHIDGLPGYSKKSAIEDGIDISYDPVDENLNMIVTFLKRYTGSENILDANFYLIGGIYGLSEVMINDLIYGINKINGLDFNFSFEGRNLLGPDNQSRNICLDTRTGNIMYFDYLENAEFYKNNRDQYGIPINIIKAPRKFESFLDVTYIPYVHV